ncbi:hypothetical protein AGMMS49949_00080 [Alphaproteobacteria bacterium]|nr:hypothetical protein AGMMS49949_00080 [Alphaproteobacteria bacterium]GHS95706.1 hypothetical protein AGMMS50296_0640 [Alphaproteobacteria bacterium]
MNLKKTLLVALAGSIPCVFMSSAIGSTDVQLGGGTLASNVTGEPKVARIQELERQLNEAKEDKEKLRKDNEDKAGKLITAHEKYTTVAEKLEVLREEGNRLMTELTEYKQKSAILEERFNTSAAKNEALIAQLAASQKDYADSKTRISETQTDLTVQTRENELLKTKNENLRKERDDNREEKERLVKQTQDQVARIEKLTKNLNETITQKSALEVSLKELSGTRGRGGSTAMKLSSLPQELKLLLTNVANGEGAATTMLGFADCGAQVYLGTAATVEKAKGLLEVVQKEKWIQQTPSYPDDEKAAEEDEKEKAVPELFLPEILNKVIVESATEHHDDAPIVGFEPGWVVVYHSNTQAVSDVKKLLQFGNYVSFRQ